MKGGRNEPCPCGSGLKYKKCCMNRETDDGDLMSGLINVRGYLLKDKEHVKKYRKLRRVHSDVIDDMVKYIDDNDYHLRVSGDILEELKLNGLKILKKKSDNYDDQMFYYVLFMFNNYEKLKSIARVFIDEKKYSSSIKRDILKGMDEAYTGLFEIVDVDR